MSTYAALVNLHQILEALVDPGGLRIFVNDRALLQSIHGRITSFLHSLENEIPSSAGERNTRLREAAYKAEDAIESQVSTILGRSDRKRSMINSCKTLCFFLCVSIYLVTPNLEGMLYWTRLFLVVAGILHSCRYISRDISTRVAFYILDAESRAQRTQELNLVMNDFNLIAEDYDGDEVSPSALLSLRRTLYSALGPDGYNKYSRYSRAQLESLYDDVCFLLGTHQAESATIRDAAHKANSLIRFQIPAQFHLDLAKIRFRRAMKLRVKALCICACTSLMWLRFYDKPVNVMNYTLHVFFSLPVLGVLTLCCLVQVAEAYFSSRVDVSEELVHSEGQESEDLAECVSKIKDACGDPSSQSQSQSQQSSSPRRELGNSSVVVGLDSDLQQIKAHLLGHSSQREVISIVGMGGIGKTTLATLAYNDSAVRPHFDIRAWVSVSQEHSLRRVLLCILDSARKLPVEMQGEEDDTKLGLHLHKSLRSRRYLIVMDDVWDTEIWDSISIYFPENYNGSRILLTSRLTDVASYPISSSSSIPLHQMQCLDGEQSWRLLREKVFGEQDRPLGLELECIGREIAQNCGGLPLAIVVIGGLLYKDSRHETWRDVARNLNRNLQAQVLEILGLSYNHLPHRLRPCFLHMAAFPGGSEIPVSKLIRLWVAEGFLKHDQTCKSLEEMAVEYLNDLNDRNLILVGKRSCNGKIRTCSIHDLLRDVCVQNAQKENFLHVVDSSGDLVLQSCGRITRRLSISLDALRVSAVQDELKGSYYVRSMLCTHGNLLNGPIKLILFQYLRVLDVVIICIDKFPDRFIELIHLKYLAFCSDCPIPPSISKLWSLQTIVHHCSHRRYPLLPRVIWSMPNLRHLYVKPGCYLSDPLGFRLIPQKISILQHLQTLMGIRNFKWSKDIMERIQNLKKLGIFYDVSSSAEWSTYQLECLADLTQLEVLKITVNYDDDLHSCDPPKLAFPQKLKKLNLRGCGIPWASMTTIGALPNLEALKLRHEACSGPSWETVEGEFPKLMFLLLENISFESWETDEHHFPLLQRLVIRSCGKLSEIPRVIGDIPTLEMIELVGCLPSAVVSGKQIQEEQEGMGNDLKLHIC